MKLLISLNDKRTIKTAIAKLKDFKYNLYPRMIFDFLWECCVKIQDLADAILDTVDIGKKTIEDIKDKWQIEVDGKKAVLLNESEKAVYLEFGVGIVGSKHKHPNASKTGYKYDIDTKYKNADRSWTFYLDDNEMLDISVNNILDRTEHHILTRGQVGYMYLFQAVEEFKENNYAITIWNDIKRKYLS